MEPVYERLTGLPYWNNPQSNWLGCKAMQTLDEVMSQAGDYQQEPDKLFIHQTAYPPLVLTGDWER